MRLLNSIIKLIFPPKCPLCEKIVEEDETLCKDCWEKIKFIKEPFCDKCSSPLDYKASSKVICAHCLQTKPLYIKLRSAVVYNSFVSKIIFKFKFYDKIHLKRFMAKVMVNAAQDIIKDIDILIPIPLHKKRLIFRKYNQSLLLAEEIAKITNKQVIYNFLYKNKHTIPQVKLKQKDRIKNIKGKFSINKNYLKEIDKYTNLNFALIDNVVTTGSTIKECIKVLNKVGIKNVYVISFAKTFYKH